MEKTIKVYNPTAKYNFKRIKVNDKVNDLNGKVIGFLWNHKPNGDIQLLSIKEKLSQRFQLAGTVWQHFEGGSSMPEDTVIDEIATTSDMVVVAIGD